jgi:peptidylprolyl isomerase
VKLRASISILALAAVTAAAQTPTTPKPPIHHAASSTAAALTPKGLPPAHGVLHTAYSLRYIDTKIGTGELAESGKFYSVQYTGWLASDGTKFDSSYDHGSPFAPPFPIGAHHVIPGWDTGFVGMHVGGKRRLFIPYQLAYGERGVPARPGTPGHGIPPKSDLIFDVELLSVSDKPPAPKLPTPPVKPPTTPGAAAPPTSTTPPPATPPPASTPPPAATKPAPAPTAAPPTPPPSPK